MASRDDGAYRAPTTPAAPTAPGRSNGAYRQPSPGTPAPPAYNANWNQAGTLNPLNRMMNGKNTVAGATGPAGEAGHGAGHFGAGVSPTSPWRGKAPSSGGDYGSQSGPTTVEDWFQKRANGTDPGWEYATGRAQDQINRQYAARGGYNSSGAVQSIGDMYANATSQREGQLDALANNATTAHQNALGLMFNTGLGLANGQSNTNWNYAKGAGDAQQNNLNTLQELILGRSGVDASKTKSITDLGVNGLKAYAGMPSFGGGGQQGGGGQYAPYNYSPFASPNSEYV